MINFESVDSNISALFVLSCIHIKITHFSAKIPFRRYKNVKISRKKYYIGGMTCVNCQNKIESALRKEAGIESVKVSYQRGTADVVYDTDWIADEKI